MAPPGSGESRRSIVKACYTKKDRNGRWTAHARYLTREGAQRQNAHGLGFDSIAEGLDLVGCVRTWEKSGDQLMWRLIVSPEDAERLDLKIHARDLVAAMERDLATHLEWVGIDHHNTDNPHVHILIRGRDHHQRKLELTREYVQQGIRVRSREIAERELGLKPEHEILAARDRVVGELRWTDLDQSIKQRVRDRVVSYYDWRAFGTRERTRIEQGIRRLDRLEELGLVLRLDEKTWELSPVWEDELRAMQRDHDLQKSRSVSRGREVERG